MREARFLFDYKNNFRWRFFLFDLTRERNIIIRLSGAMNMREPEEKEYLDVLVSIGLNRREAQIYLSLLTRHDFTASEVAKLAGLSRPATYELLDKMVRLGICKEKSGNVKRFQAVSPVIALSRIIEHQAEELKSRESLVAGLKPALEDLFERSREQDDPLEYFEVLRDKRQIAERYREMTRQSKHEMLSFTKPPYTTVVPQGTNPEEAKAIQRGVRIRIICEYDSNSRDAVENIATGIAHGEEARIIRSLPLKLAIFDSKECLLAMHDPITGKMSLTTIYINHRDFALLLKETFEAYWAKAIPYEEFKKNQSLID
jgi:HTH-type transcriptional regulator, sugar sensing transcriptional regulator